MILEPNDIDMMKGRRLVNQLHQDTAICGNGNGRKFAEWMQEPVGDVLLYCPLS